MIFDEEIMQGRPKRCKGSQSPLCVLAFRADPHIKVLRGSDEAKRCKGMSPNNDEINAMSVDFG